MGIAAGVVASQFTRCTGEPSLAVAAQPEPAKFEGEILKCAVPLEEANQEAGLAFSLQPGRLNHFKGNLVFTQRYRYLELDEQGSELRWFTPTLDLPLEPGQRVD